MNNITKSMSGLTTCFSLCHKYFSNDHSLKMFYSMCMYSMFYCMWARVFKKLVLFEKTYIKIIITVECSEFYDPLKSSKLDETFNSKYQKPTFWLENM